MHVGNEYVVPPIGLGCGAIQPEDAERVLRTALDAGYRLFDCALLYRNETFIGDALEKIFKEGKYRREDILITTKLPMIGNHPKLVKKFLLQSLKNLKLSYVDLYLIHFPVGFVYQSSEEYFPKKDGIIQLDFATNILEVWKAMEAQVEAKRTRFIGLSNFNQDQISRILQIAHIPPVNLQIEVHAHFQQQGLREFCKNHDIFVSAYAPLGSPGRRIEFKPNGVPGILNDKTVGKIAEKHAKSPSQVLLRFMVQEGIIPLPKSSKDDRIRANIDIFNFTLSHEDIINLRCLDKGDEGRSFDYLKIFDGLNEHPENPITEVYRNPMDTNSNVTKLEDRFSG